MQAITHVGEAIKPILKREETLLAAQIPIAIAMLAAIILTH